ncbi:MAG: LamG-like jellyroll fold domain-containing protein [Pseudomonadales bacterium]
MRCYPIWLAAVIVLLWANVAQAERLCSDSSSAASAGTLTDSGGNGRYRNNEFCTFNIQASGGEEITLTFVSFDMEANDDFLRIYDGTSTAAPLLGSFTGTSLPPTVTATSGNMLIVGETDGRTRARGFEADWQIVAAATCSQQSVADDFASVSYTQNSGSQTWLSDWIEIGESDGPSAGIARVNNSNCSAGNCLRIGDPNRSSYNGRGARRAVDLAGATAATLSFVYRTGHSRGSQTVDLEITADGGSTWTTLTSYRINQTSFSGTAQSFDISSYATADTQIRFISDGNNATSGLYVDDVVITYQPTCAPSAVAEWRFDEVSWLGLNAVADEYGQLPGQAIGGADTVSGGQICRAGSFDGLNDYVDVPGIDSHLRDTASLSFWLLTDQGGTNTAWLAPGVTGIEENGGIDDIFWGYIRAAGTISLATGDTNPSFSTTPINDSNWHHVVLTRDAATGNLNTYVDGVLENSDTDASGQIGNGFSSLGRIEDTGLTPEYLRGTLDEVVIFDTVLNAAEVQTIYNNQRAGNNWDGTPRACPTTGLGLIRIEHDGAGIHCTPEPVTVRMLDAAGNPLTGASQQITLDTQSGRGSWTLVTGSGTLVDATLDDGLATYQFSLVDAGEAVFALDYRQGTPTLNIAVSLTANPSITDDDTEGTLTFASTGFTVTANPLSNPPPSPIVDPITTQQAGYDFPVHLSVYGTTPDDPVCGVIESYTGTRNLAFWLSRSDPASGSIAASIDSNSIADNAAGATPQTVTFSAGQAAVTMRYKDAGAISLQVSDALSQTPAINGASNTFVVQPDYLHITSVTSAGGTPNPGATSLNTDPFVPSGEAFRVVVTARDADHDITPNFGLESAPETIRLFSNGLLAPAGGRNGSSGDILNGTAFARSGAGEFTSTSIIFDEVGIISLSAQVADNDYLGSGPVDEVASGNVGRFYVDHFEMIDDDVVAACNGFTYAGQNALSISMELAANNALGNRVHNYDATLFGSLPLAQVLMAAEDNDGGIDLGARLVVDPADWVAGRYQVSQTDAQFSRAVAPDGPFSNLQLGARVLDPTDARLLLDLDMNAGSSGDCLLSGTCTAHAVGPPSRVRHGRLSLGAGSAPEFADLDLPLLAEYWDGLGFRTNTLDNCTPYDITLVSLSAYQGNLSAGETLPTQPASNQPLVGGAPDPVLLLSAPGAGNDGSVLVEIAAPGWLQFDWFGTGLTSPAERQTFGSYRGHDGIVYWDEVTRE